MDYRGAVIDLDGTVYRGQEPLPGAPAAVDALRAAGLFLLFLSNNPTKTRTAYVDRLGGMGIETDASEILSAGTVTTEFLAAEHADDELFVIGSDGLREQLAAAGLHEIDDPAAAEVLVVSWDVEFDYHDMTAGYRALADGETAFVGSDPDRVVPTGDGEMIPGSGAIINAVAGVAEREPDRVLGKPSPEAIDAAETALGIPPEDCVLVGDRLDTDIAMGERAGMTTVLVLTGVTTRDDVEAADVSPDYVCESLADVPALL